MLDLLPIEVRFCCTLNVFKNLVKMTPNMVNLHLNTARPYGIILVLIILTMAELCPNYAN